MELQEALRQADAHLKNALDQLKIPMSQRDMFLGAEDQVTAVDNLTTALDNFLADTESLPDAKLKQVRGEIRDAKKRLTDTVVAFEAQKEGAAVEGGEPSAEEWAEAYIEMAGEMLDLAKQTLGKKVKDVQALGEWEDPLAVINGFLADSEPYQEASRDLRKARSMVRVARKELKAHIDEVVAKWKAADRAAAAEGDSEDDD